MTGPTNRPDTNTSPGNQVLLGRIGAAHGIRGEVRISTFTANPTDIADYSPFKTNRPGVEITILKIRAAKNVVVASLKGITDRNAAERLNGIELYIDRNALPEPDDEDDFYLADLIGLEARLEDGTSAGRVISVENFGAGDLIEIGTSAKSGTLYPFTRAIVPEIKITEGYLVLVPPAEIEVKETGDEE